MADTYELDADEDGAEARMPPPRMPPSFILAPLNSAAKKVTDHDRNAKRRYENSNTFGLWIGFTDPPEVYETTLGRGRGTDIYLPEVKNSKGSSQSQISDVQASFEVVPTTGAVILRDYSEHANTEPFPPSSSAHHVVTVKFRSGRRSVLVARGINSRIAFGRDKYYQFEIQWISDGMYNFPKDGPYIVGPRESKPKKYIEGKTIGGGAYGVVCRAMDITNGTLIAVKRFHSLSGKRQEFATREVANMVRINKSKSIHHDHILQILDSAGGEKKDDWGEIMMPLKDGNLKRLVEDFEGTNPAVIPAMAERVLYQMLLALECLAAHSLIHRDIKPENILWEYDSNGDYHFCLGDFGLSHDPKLAHTVAGTEPFMAPEVFTRKSQSTKVDIWSLFATFVWINNTHGFRNDCWGHGPAEIHEWLVEIAKGPEFARTRGMARRDPKKRPSAKQQLAILADESGEYEYPAEFADGGEDPDADALDSQFSRMNVGDDSGIGYLGPDMDSTNSSGSPGRAYYEPYTTGLYPSHDDDKVGGQSIEHRPPWYQTEEGESSKAPARGLWDPAGVAGPSRRFASPAMGGRNVPREQPQQAYVAPYGEVYGPFEDLDNDTAGPDFWTARPPTEVDAGSRDRPGHKEKDSSKKKQKDKGKHRS